MDSILLRKAKSFFPPLAVNSLWGLFAQISQSVLLSFFFVLLARIYAPYQFSNFIVATVFYQLFAAFSTFGLNQWYIRQYVGEQQTDQMTGRYFSIQFRFGLLFYILSIGFAFLLYQDKAIRVLYLLLGMNIFFDNIISAIKSINIAEQDQKKTFIITGADALGKLLIVALAFLLPITVEWLALLLILYRLLTLRFFLSFGTDNAVSLSGLLASRVSLSLIKAIIVDNWAFVVIGALSIINWRFGTILISKTLSPLDVANYEIGYRFFSIVQMVAVAVIGTAFPLLAKYWSGQEVESFRSLYWKLHHGAVVYGCLAFSFLFFFAGDIIPLLFKSTYSGAVHATKLMSATILIFPVAFLQANVLVAANRERADMVLNCINLGVNVCGALIGVLVIKSAGAVMVSIFISFILFHVAQEILLINMGLSSVWKALVLYLFLFSVLFYHYLAPSYLNKAILFPGFSILVIGLYYLLERYQKTAA